MRKISIAKDCVMFIKSDIDKYPDVETGGVFFGEVDQNCFFIKKVIDGGEKAIRERYLFRADKHYVDMNIDMVQANTNLKYLGEWHTHPQTIPVPSEQDLISINEISESANNFSLLLIIGFLEFDIRNFVKQSIAIVKFHEMEDFFKISIVVEK